MKRIALLVLLSMSAATLPSYGKSTVCENPIHVMLTAFEPFGGKNQNGSQIVATELEKLNSNTQGLCIQYQTCILPVEYERGAKEAVKCFEKSNPKPSMVIAMGEVGCDVRLETMAHNLNDTPGLPDNAQKIIENKTINKNAPKEELLTLPVADMYCAARPLLGPPTESSTSPGYYVCNDVAYRFARYLKPRQIPFGFIHVPVAEYCNSVDPAKTAEKIFIMTQVAVRALSVSTSVFAKNFPAYSSDLKNATAVDQTVDLQKLVTPTCRQQVMNDLRLQSDMSRFEPEEPVEVKKKSSKNRKH